MKLDISLYLYSFTLRTGVAQEQRQDVAQEQRQDVAQEQRQDVFGTLHTQHSFAYAA